MRRALIAGLFCGLGFYGLLLAGCKAAVSDQAFSEKIAQADGFIASGNPREGLRIIRSLAKKPLGVSQRLGLYRRFRELGGDKDGEKWLVRWLKQQQDSADLNAVYAALLIQQGRFPEAEERASLLAGTPFASLLAELEFWKVPRHSDSHRAFKQILPELFESAYTVTQNQVFLEEAAVLYAAQGNIQKAAALPVASPLLRGALLLDKGDVLEALEYLKALSQDANPADKLEGLLLQTDALGRQGDDPLAEQIRSRVLRKYAPQELPPALFYNSARDAQNRQDTNARYVLLTSLVQLWPDYAPGMKAYGDYALEALPAVSDTGLAGSLRDVGMRSRQMAVQDQIPRVSPDAVLKRRRDSSERTGAVDMIVEYLQFSHMLNPQDTKFTLLWDYLEQHLGPDNSYPPELARYGVSALLNQGQKQQGADLFLRYIRGRYGGTDPLPLLPRLAAWEVETFAWLAAAQGSAALTEQLYTYLVSKVREINPKAVHEDQYHPGAYVFVNLAEVYQGTGRLSKAIAIYQDALASPPIGVKTGEILYRLGKAQKDSQAISQAIRSLEACLSLNPDHQKALLLLHEIRGSF
jgi:tetratricopeptide (TPR) repeat protein